MPEEKKYGKSKKKNKKFFHRKSENENLPKNALVEQIENAVSGLYYMSEMDAEIFPFIGGKAELVNKETIFNQTQNFIDAQIEEKDFTQLFARLTEIQDWFGDEETATAEKYSRLRDLLVRNLRDLKVFKIGKIQIDIYVVGLDAENTLLGIKTKAVET